jgi:hypothetical protein
VTTSEVRAYELRVREGVAYLATGPDNSSPVHRLPDDTALTVDGWKATVNEAAGAVYLGYSRARITTDDQHYGRVIAADFRR